MGVKMPYSLWVYLSLTEARLMIQRYWRVPRSGWVSFFDQVKRLLGIREGVKNNFLYFCGNIPFK